MESAKSRMQRWSSVHTRILFAVLSICVLSHCSGAAKKSSSYLLEDRPFPNSSEVGAFCKRWSYNTNANLSYLTSSTATNNLLLSTSANRGSPRNFQARIQLLNASGKTLWSKWLKQPVKAQSISDNAHFIAFSNYEDLLYFMNASGKVLWTKDHLGIPKFLNSKKELLVINDEDSAPETVFYLYSYAGTLLYSGTTTLKAEPLDVSVSHDEEYLAAALKGMTWNLYHLNGNKTEKISTQKIEGEITAINTQTVSKVPNVFTLNYSASSSSKQSLARYDGKSGSLLWKIDLDERFEMLRSAFVDGKLVLFLYVNSSHGQGFEMRDAESGNLLWNASISGPANYTSPVHVFEDDHANESFFSVLVDRSSSSNENINAGILHIAGFKTSKNPYFSFDFGAPDGVYAYAIHPKKLFITIGAGKSGDAAITAFSPCKSKRK